MWPYFIHNTHAHLHVTINPQVRDWYVESFKDLRAFAPIKNSADEVQFTDLLKHIYNRHKVCVWQFAAGVCNFVEPCDT